jgi:hypothetical protein
MIKSSPSFEYRGGAKSSPQTVDISVKNSSGKEVVLVSLKTKDVRIGQTPIQ